VASGHAITVLMADSGFEGTIPRGTGVAVLSPKTATSADIRRPGSEFFVVAAATELAPVSAIVHEASSAHRLRALFVRADIEYTWLLPMLDRANVRTLRNTLVHTSARVPERVLRAWRNGVQRELIADATVFGDRLYVRSCALEGLDVAFGGVPALAKMPVAERGRFTLDDDGSFLHWEWSDTHIGMESLRYALDPGAKRAADLRRLSADRRFGGAVRTLRLQAGLRQASVEGLSAKQVSRIEAGSGVPRLETVRRLAAAHGMSAGEYLDEVAGLLVTE
jgi:hypothetical protein